MKGGLAGLGLNKQKEAVSRIAIDHVLSLVCQEFNATLSLEEFLGDVESRSFPCAVCDYVLRDSTGRVAAVVEAKRCLTEDMSLQASGVVQVAIQILQAADLGVVATKHLGLATDGRRWAALCPTVNWFALTPALDLLDPGAETVLRGALAELLACSRV